MRRGRNLVLGYAVVNLLAWTVRMFGFAADGHRRRFGARSL